MNDFLDAINDSKNETGTDGEDSDASEERYNELKKEEAEVDGRSPAKQRYQELKDKAKEEMMREERQKEDSEPEAVEESEGHEEEDEEEFITY